jgi:hypothetical protein
VFYRLRSPNLQLFGWFGCGRPSGLGGLPFTDDWVANQVGERLIFTTTNFDKIQHS